MTVLSRLRRILRLVLLLLTTCSLWREWMPALLSSGPLSLLLVMKKERTLSLMKEFTSHQNLATRKLMR